MWRGFVLFIGLSFCSVSEAEACRSVIKDLETALARASFHLALEARTANTPQIHGRPLHLTTQITLPFIWVTNSKMGTDYAVVHKGDTGFGFSSAVVERFEFLKSDNLYLRSLDFSGEQDKILVTLVHQDPESGVKSLILQAAGVANMSSGLLTAIETEPFIIEDVEDTLDEFVVSPRPGTSEFWITDASRRVRIVRISETGGLEATAFELPSDIRIEGKSKQLTKILKIQFLPDSEQAYIKFQTKEGKIYLTRLALTQVNSDLSPAELQSAVGAAVTLNQEVSHGLDIDFMNAIELAPGSNRSSVHPNQNLIFVSYPQRIDVYRMRDGLEKLTELDVSHITEGYELNGIEFYWEGEWRAPKDESSQAQFFGEVKALLLLWDESKQESRLAWVKIGKPKVSR